MARLVIAAIEAKGLHSKQSLLQIVLRSYGASQDICSFLSFVRTLEVLLCPASSEESESKSRFVPPLHTFPLSPFLELLITAGSGGGDRSGGGARPMARQSVHSALSLSLSEATDSLPPPEKNHSLSLFIPSPSFLPLRRCNDVWLPLARLSPLRTQKEEEGEPPCSFPRKAISTRKRRRRKRRRKEWVGGRKRAVGGGGRQNRSDGLGPRAKRHRNAPPSSFSSE